MSNSSKKVAIVGAGPAGLYAAEALIKNDPNIIILIFEALFCPYGLVRSGVAPDHQKIKEVTKLFDKTLSKENVHFFGNLKIGRDLSIDELKKYVNAIVLCTGAHKDKSMQIKGEELSGVNTATNFVGWYNSHPWFENIEFDLNCETVAVIGQGNVAVDVSRILLKDPEALKTTDISRRALEKLKNSKIKNIYMIGRRGPLQAAFTDKELQELGTLNDVYISVSKEDLILTEDETAWLATTPKGTQRNFSILNEFSNNTYNGQSKILHIKFFSSPKEFIGDTKIEKIILEKNILSGPLESRSCKGTGQFEEINTNLILKSVGYYGEGLPDLPFDLAKGTYIHKQGQLTEANGIFTSGWIKRGPSGVIGTNKADSVETVAQVMAYLENSSSSSLTLEDLIRALKEKDIKYIDFPTWKILDTEEVMRGNNISPRIKFQNNREALDYLASL